MAFSCYLLILGFVFIVCLTFDPASSACKDLDPEPKNCIVTSHPIKKCPHEKAARCPLSCNQCDFRTYKATLSRTNCIDSHWIKCDAIKDCTNSGFIYCRKTCDDCLGGKYEKWARRAFREKYHNFYTQSRCYEIKNQKYRHPHEIKACKKFFQTYEKRP